jgi:hypothetical protein
VSAKNVRDTQVSAKDVWEIQVSTKSVLNVQVPANCPGCPPRMSRMSAKNVQGSV